MKKMYWILMIAAVTGTVGTLYAAMWRFHSGQIACAEITTRDIIINNQDKFAFSAKYNKTAYAVVVCRLDSGRSISIYDYSISDGVNTYPCVAIKSGNGGIAIKAGSGDFDGRAWKLDTTSTSTLYSLLFRIEAPKSEPDKTVEMTLEYNYGNRRRSRLKIPFKYLGSEDFTGIAKIPEGGMMPEQS